jgi:hypothetical protein
VSWVCPMESWRKHFFMICTVIRISQGKVDG